MAVKRKVKSKIALPAQPEKIEKVAEEAKPERRENTKRYCHFCKTHTVPAYWDVAALRRCLNDRGRIIPRARTGTCAKHQRLVGREIKRARHLAMLPFTVRL